VAFGSVAWCRSIFGGAMKLEDKPSPDDARKLAEVSDDTPVEESGSLPSSQEQLSGGYVLEFVGFIKNKYQVFKKRSFGGKLLSILIALHIGINFWDDINRTSKVVYDFSTDAYSTVSTYLESHDTTHETADGYLVNFPNKYQNTDIKELLTEFPVGSGIAPMHQPISGQLPPSGLLG